MSSPSPSAGAQANPARALAARVLNRVLFEGAYAAPALDTALERGKLPARDAGLATHLVYGTLRFHPALERTLNPMLSEKTPPKARVLLLMGAFEKFYLETPEHAVVNEYVELAKVELGKLSGVVNAVLRRVPKPEDPYALPESLKLEFEAVYGEEADPVMKSLLEPSPLWLWCSDEGVKLLEDEGALLEKPIGEVYQATLGMSLRSSEAYKRGQVQPINPASLAVVSSLGEVRNQKVLDLAGGNGIKAGFLARAGAQITSVDLDPRKHEAARKNLERLGLEVEFAVQDLAGNVESGLVPAPYVLLDAPCSGTGTLRGHPEIKLRFENAKLEELVALQARMLENAALLVEPSGLLVYSVCSVVRSEGVQQVRTFLERHPEFVPEAFEPSVPVTRAEVGVYTVPLEGLDGFYIARLRRRSET